jgi:elongator complex protein 4
VARHAAAAGLLDGQRLLVLSPLGAEWAAGLPWVEGESGLEAGAESESETEAMEDDGRTKIAWRYDKMAKFRTSVGESAPSPQLTDLGIKLTPGSSRLAANTTLPAPLRAQLEAAGTISYVDPGDGLTSALEALAAALAAAPTDQVVRVVVPDLGSRDWPLAAPEIPRFLLCLRALLRPRPAVGIVTLPPALSTSPTSSSSASPSSPDNAWITSLAHASDACLTLQGFGTAPGHFRAFAPLHGLLTPHALPSPHHLLSPACRHSTLLGVKDGGEQNLGFRLKRKKFVVESVHLGIEGGTSERRTAPVEKVVPAVDKAAVAEAAEGVERAATEKAAVVEPASAEKEKPKKPRARVRFGGDEVAVTIDKNERAHGHDHPHPHSHPKPRVEIRHDRPDLYEF